MKLLQLSPKSSLSEKCCKKIIADQWQNYFYQTFGLRFAQALACCGPTFQKTMHFPTLLQGVEVPGTTLE